jgi:phosphopentomutase
MATQRSPRRIICLVADGLGVGAGPDASRYGDLGSHTLGNTAKAVGGIRLPTLEKLGIGCLGSIVGVAPNSQPLARVMKLTEKSKGKDTTTGHWELAGLITEEPFATFPDGFPLGLLDAWVREAGLPGYLGNKAASGTTILDELGEEHLKTGKPIVYTSADSVLQIAMHESQFGIERLYQVCQVAREMTRDLKIGRVIARPFVGQTTGQFKRTEKRRDFSIAPGRNCLDVINESGIEVLSVGKIDDIFDHRAISRGNHTGNNADSLRATLDFMKQSRGKDAFIFTNLVDFDMLYGHRRDPKGYAGALAQLDAFYPELLKELGPEDLLLLTSDHGCDPTFPGSDHTREFVPLIAYGPGLSGKDSGIRQSFADVAATVLDAFGLPASGLPGVGQSILG